MQGIGRRLLRLAAGGVLGGFTLVLIPGPAHAAAPEWNAVRTHSVPIGAEAGRLVVGFRATAGNTVAKAIRRRNRAQSILIVQAQTSDADAAGLARRTGLAMAGSRQITPSTHVLYLQKTLYGADVDAALKKLRADPAVLFADVDQRRYPQALPDDPLFLPTADASGQWYMHTPSATSSRSMALPPWTCRPPMRCRPGPSPRAAPGRSSRMWIPGCVSIIPICCGPAWAAGCCRATISWARTTTGPREPRSARI